MEKEEQSFRESGENEQETGKESGSNALTPGSQCKYYPKSTAPFFPREVTKYWHAFCSRQVTCTCDKNMDQGTKAGATTDAKDATCASPHSNQTASEDDDSSTDRCLLFLLQQHQDFLNLMIQQHEQLQHIEEQLCWVFPNAD
ncbi:uncharacterized protein LOC106175812 isoform X1 [Lingula anatina]|uniref:Uncharacterized protein LOC106175812 isoform X1 n=1 Tax=Lingula anatina TaxID=7574 RepID=A0A1S3JTM5_LINAN|nr:uncharacterized protein LOC106175812 isoform X1 [Lingula anatina]|eukprot:XP_013413419.1 uncharacterized protein LOC106175812 isoform X1 [Lingula anatina]